MSSPTQFFHRRTVMGCFELLCFLCLIFMCSSLTTSQPTYRYYFCEGANYTNNSTYRANLDLLFSSLSSHVIPGYRFYDSFIGQNPPDIAYGLFLCTANVNIDICKTCVENATKAIIERCPTQKESLIIYDDCMLRYSNRSIFSTMQRSPSVYRFNTQSSSNPQLFDQRLGNLMNSLVTRAADDTSAKFATGEADYINFQKIYGLVQCTPDLSQSDCNSCLDDAVVQIPICCSGREGGTVIQPSCFVRYEVYPFYASSSTSSPPGFTNTTTSTTKGKGKGSSRTVVLVVIFSVVAVALLAITICLFLRKRTAMEKVENEEEITSLESLQFDFDSIEAATINFSDANKLGKGGFGAVYKGRLSDGQEIAVKRLSRNSGQGEEQFKNEVLLVAKLQHRNLVKLLGFCIEGEERLLIYEFVPNTSLDRFIFDPIKRALLNWETRYKIIGGIARGLLYLHEDSRHRIIHRDLKASNILLDTKMNPKISDFGMARLVVMDQTQGSTDRIVGTYGYMSPEYAMHGHFSVKSDVYSFGVLLLEIVSGQKNNSFYDSEHFENLLSYAWRHWRDGKALELTDPTLRDSCLPNEVIRCIQIGLLCVQDSVADRPTMTTVVLMLSSYSGTLSTPSPPSYCVNDTMNSSTPMSNLKPCSVNGLSLTEMHPR